MSYHRFKSEDGTEYGSFEVFYVPPRAGGDGPSVEHFPTIYPKTGWYWWACFPGCLPDGDPQGPYESEEEAIQMAQAEA